MNLHEVNVRTVQALAALGWDYVIVGGIAATHYGLARATYDLDLVVAMEPARIGELARLLGEEFELDPQQSFEVFTGKVMRVIQVPGTPYKIDVFPLSQDPFDQALFRRGRQVRLEDSDVVIASVEDLIVQKLRWAREKDTLDARDMLAVQGTSLDFAYIERWCDAHGTRPLLDKLRSEIPPI